MHDPDLEALDALYLEAARKPSIIPPQEYWTWASKTYEAWPALRDRIKELEAEVEAFREAVGFAVRDEVPKNATGDEVRKTMLGTMENLRDGRARCHDRHMVAETRVKELEKENEDLSHLLIQDTVPERYLKAPARLVEAEARVKELEAENKRLDGEAAFWSNR